MKVIFIVLLLTLVSCGQSEKMILNDMIGKEIHFPNNMLDINVQQACGSGVKILSFVDGNSCTECYLKTLKFWDIISPVVDSLNCSILFVFSPKDENLKDLIPLIRMECKYPAKIDINNEFILKNKFMGRLGVEYNTVLLNAENEIELVGNPVYNIRVWNLYKNVIPTIVQSGIKSDEE